MWVGVGLGVEQTINSNLTKFKAQNKISIPQRSSTPENQLETLGCVVIGQYFYLVGGFDAHLVQFFFFKMVKIVIYHCLIKYLAIYYYLQNI